MKYFKMMLLALLLFTETTIAEQVKIGDDSYEVMPGDLLTLPNRPGTATALIWGNTAIWYDIKDEWFHGEPIRNYTTQIFLQIPRLVNVGDYQLFQIEYTPDADPRWFSQWSWAKVFNIRIKAPCNDFRLC